jgi:DNA-binding transcriptional MerR regulator
MTTSIRDLSCLDRTAAWLEELITLCRPRGLLAGKDPARMRDVTRKAKALATSLAKFRDALDDPNHQPTKGDEPVSKHALGYRLYQERCLYELARFISYGGRRIEQVREFMAGHSQRHGQKAGSALSELTMMEERTGLTVLRPEARKACRVLLGPPPESPEYQRYWQLQQCPPPAEHQPPSNDPSKEEMPAESQVKAPPRRKHGKEKA